MKNFKLLLALAIGFVLGGISFTLNNEGKKELNNEIVFIWEGLDKDIPKDGDQLINLSTNENIVYLNPVD